MLGIGTALAGLGINFISDLIKDNGEDLVKEGIKKVTGIDLTKTKPKDLTPEQIQVINESEYKLKALDFEKMKLDYANEQKQEENITQRWVSDNNSDSRFAKLLRPALTIYLVFVATILAILDGNVDGFNIKLVWVELFTALCITAVGGYFVLRTYEKRTGTSKWK